MTINDILSIYNKVNEKLYTGCVSEAFFLIRKIIKEINDWNMSMEIDEYSSTYLQMLSHSIATKEFTRNEESRHIYNRLVFNLFMLVQKAKETFLLRQSNLIEYEGQRLEPRRSKDVVQLRMFPSAQLVIPAAPLDFLLVMEPMTVTSLTVPVEPI